MISSVTLNCVNLIIYALFNFCFWLFCYFWHLVIFLFIYLFLACEKNIGWPVIPSNQFTTCLRWHIFNLNLIDSPWIRPNTTCLLGPNKKLGNPHYTSDLRILHSFGFFNLPIMSSFERLPLFYSSHFLQNFLDKQVKMFRENGLAKK